MPAGKTFSQAELRSRSRDRRGEKDSARSSSSKMPNDKEEEEQSDLTGDWHNVFILLLLYTLQGVPMGLGAAIPMVLQEKGATIAELGVFSFCSLPFSFKLLWAPLVDSLYIKSFGLRKTWLVSSQMCIGITMILSAPSMARMVGSETERPDVVSLMWLFFLFFFMCATQDIAVDGWALTMLQKRNINYASTCNAIGQSLGNALAFVGYLALDHYQLVDLPSFMMAWGFLFIAVTVVVAVLKTEVPEDVPDYREAYKQMFLVLKCPAVRELLLVLLTSKVGFAAAESLSSVKMQAAGMPKEHLAYIGLLVTPISIFLPGLVPLGTKPLNTFMQYVVPRVVLGLLSAVFIFMAPSPWPTDKIPWTYYGAGLAITALASAVSTVMFVAQMAFFARVSDPTIGGTYMTMLNTVANLAHKWPSSLIFFLVDWSTVKDEATGEVLRDGYYTWSVICAALAVVWLLATRSVVERMQNRPLDDWRVSS